jgi:hypothetical protein
MRQLGPTAEVNIKVKIPQAFLDYINEIEKRTWVNIALKKL